MARRRRASGVRKSCDTPASKSVLSESSKANDSVIWLKV